MLIQCTKKLLDELKIKPASSIEEQPLFSWHANLITVNRRKTVVLCNNKNRYIVVLHGLKTKDFKHLGELIISAIRETLIEECIKSEIIDQFINSSPEVAFTKTSSRSMTAKLIKACEFTYNFATVFNSENIIQTDVGIRASKLLVGEDSSDKYYTPSEAMYKDLENFGESPIFRCKALQLKVTLDLENHEVWRRIIVPNNFTFTKLHDIMQIVFDWKDYHLHDFYIFDGEKPIVNLVSDSESLAYADEDIDTMLEKGIKLSAYVPQYTQIKYNYDFGDDWQHYIEVENSINDYAQNYPICIAGEGNAPPEDVGGEGGYDEFLEAMADPNHEDHADMVSWSKMQLYRDFDIEFVNRRLKYSLKSR